MDAKKKRIIETAIPLFAKKGVHATSIQEISDAAGMAKGTLYLYFKSKDDLFHSSLLHILEQMETLTNTPQADVNKPRESLVRHLARLIRFALDYRDFFLMLLNERVTINEDELHCKMAEQRSVQLQRLCAHVRSIYDEKAEPYVLDAASMIQAVVTQYCVHALLDGVPIDAEQLAVFVVNRVDEWIHGMIRKGEKPVLRDPSILYADRNDAVRRSAFKEEVRMLKEALLTSPLMASEREEGLLYAQVLENELRKPEPVSAVVQGILLTFASSRSASVSEAAGRLLEKVAAVAPAGS